MDQLKKVLEYKFWILLAVACLAPMVGWFLGHGSMVQAYTEGKSQKDKIFAAIPQGVNPNASWKDQADAINKQQEAKVAETWVAIYEEQQKAKVWPAGVPADLDTAKPDQLSPYPEIHARERTRIWELVRPRVAEENRGVVDFSLAMVPQVDWPRRAPPAKMIRDAQEDLWLTAALLEAIDRVNQGNSTQFDAPIRQILEYLLRGGGGEKSGEGKSKNNNAGLNAGAGVESGNAASSGDSSADFNPDEELGAEKEDTEAAKPEAPNKSSGVGRAAASVQKQMGRYVDDKTHFKTRGFYLKLLMDHNAVPRLVVELSNSQQWPVKILRVQQSDLYHAELQEEDRGNNAGGNAMGAPGMEGAPGMQGAKGGPPGMSANKSSGSRFQAKSGGQMPMPDAGAVGEMPSGEGSNAQANSSALTDSKLAYVCITGVITIYKSPPAPAAPPPGTPAPNDAKSPLAQGPASPMPPANNSPMPKADSSPMPPVDAAKTAADTAAGPAPGDGATAAEEKPLDAKAAESAPAESPESPPPAEDAPKPAESGATPSPDAAKPAETPPKPGG